MVPRTLATASSSRSIALVIDDAPESLGMISTALEGSGMTVLVARSGEEGLGLAQRVNPDVILLDAVMPGLDGFETCRRLKAPPIAEKAPVIFMTGLSEPEHILKGLQAGGVDYITKPVVVDELIARITVHVLNARALSSARAALEYAGQNVLALHEDGRLAWATQSASLLLMTPDGSNLIKDGAATQELLIWMTDLLLKPLSHARPLTIGRLSLTLLGRAAGEVALRLREITEESDEKRLSEAFGLTLREAEVLLWLSHGKTNRDIADILSLSARTVNKHLEQIFHKMGIDNRTSAAVMADRIIQNS